jgi:hypothetical protein
MTASTRLAYGVYEMTLVAPTTLLNSYYIGSVLIEGSDVDTLEYAATEAICQRLGKHYDDLPEEWTPFVFADPVLSANEFRNPDGSQQWFVGVYTVDRAYGGPEEGGWWFDTGELELQTAVATHDDAEELRETYRSGEYDETGARFSVLPGEDYRIVIGIRPHPAHYPEEWPRYE